MHSQKLFFIKRVLLTVLSGFVFFAAFGVLPKSYAYAIQDHSTMRVCGIRVTALSENIHIVICSWELSGDSIQDGKRYFFAVGSQPAQADIQPWQECWGKTICFYPREYGCKDKDVIFVSLKVCADNANDIIGVSNPVLLSNNSLGAKTNKLTIKYASQAGLGGTLPWSKEQIERLEYFTARMIPIIHEVYGPSARDYTVTLARNPSLQSAIFFSHSNEIHLGDLWNPQLLTHELVHAYRDNVMLSSDANWRYDSTLSAFEEGFAEAVSYECMNRYNQEYPKDPYVNTDFIWTSNRIFDYASFNVTELTSQQNFHPERGAMYLSGLRYSMANEAICRIAQDRPDFYKRFNHEWYLRLKENPQLCSSRYLVTEIIRKISPLIEGMDASEWLNRQHIFSCRVN